MRGRGVNAENATRWNAASSGFSSGSESGLGNAKTSMPAPDFLDTNVLVYAYDASSPKKQRVAQDLVRRAVAGEIVISSQVLAEVVATLLHKLSPAASSGDVLALLDALGPIKIVVPDAAMLRRSRAPPASDA